MITNKEILKKIKRIKAVEDIFRQIAEEKQYLVASFNVNKFHKEAEHILNKKIKKEYVEWWLSGYRRKNKN
jgi:hypothetical protein